VYLIGHMKTFPVSRVVLESKLQPADLLVNLLARLTARPHSSEAGRLDFALDAAEVFS